eukprot:764635-Hanusia_phi.AAC.3
MEEREVCYDMLRRKHETSESSHMQQPRNVPPSSKTFSQLAKKRHFLKIAQTHVSPGCEKRNERLGSKLAGEDIRSAAMFSALANLETIATQGTTQR